jgi:hypothetical protein
MDTDTVFNVVSGVALLGSLFLWLIGSLWVLYALIKPRTVAKDKKGIRVLIAYFLNAALWVFASEFPASAHAVFESVKAAFVSSSPYADLGAGLAYLTFVWVSPFVVVGFIVWLILSTLAGMTASEVARRQRGQR